MPRDRETKPCPKCGKTAVFNNRSRVPGSGTEFAGEGGDIPAVRYEPAWKCELCDYHEKISN